MLDDVQGQDHRVNERRRQPVVLWRGKGEQIDILLLLAWLGCRVRADDGSAGRGDGNGEEGGHDDSDVGFEAQIARD